MVRTAFALVILWAVALVLGAPTLGQQMYQQASATPTPTATPTLGPITHIIVVVQENRTFDNLFMNFAGAQSSTTAQICTVAVGNNCTSSTTFTVLPYDLFGSEPTGNNHGHNGGATTECDPTNTHARCGGPGGAPNGWALEGGCGPNTCMPNGIQGGVSCQPTPFATDSHSNPVDGCAMYYVHDNSANCVQGAATPTPTHTPGCTNLNLDHELVTNGYGTLGDHSFQENIGPSSAGHCMLVFAQCGYPTSWVNQQNGGCYQIQKSADTIDMTAAYPGHVTGNGVNGCISLDSVFDRVHAKGLTSKLYWGQDGFWNPAAWEPRLCGTVSTSNPVQPGQPYCLFDSGIVSFGFPETTFLTDAASGSPSTCNLPNLSYVMPSAANSDHGSTGENGFGPVWVASIVNAIGANTACWNSSEILITWDDWGGWFDDVTPPAPSDDTSDPNMYNFRVPLIILSPYIKTPGAVDTTVRDAYASIVRNAETLLVTPQSGQCSGTFFSGGGWPVVRIGHPLTKFGLCQRDARGEVDDLTADLNTARSPIPFTPIAYDPMEQVRVMAATTDNGAALMLSQDWKQRMLGERAMAYAAAPQRHWDSVAFRLRCVDCDPSEGEDTPGFGK